MLRRCALYRDKNNQGPVACLFLCPDIAEVGCQDTEKGENYLGAVERTVTGHRCKPWGEVTLWQAFGYLTFDKVQIKAGRLLGME